MSFSATLMQTPVTAMPFSHLLIVMVQLTLLGGMLMFFRPLLLGVARALLLVVRPRSAKQVPTAANLNDKADLPAVGAHS